MCVCVCVCVCVVGGRVRVSMTLPLGNVCVCVSVCVRGWVTCISTCTCMYIRSTTITSSLIVNVCVELTMRNLSLNSKADGHCLITCTNNTMVYRLHCMASTLPQDPRM